MPSRGLSAVTKRQIAKGVGCSDSALYAHFEGRLEVLLDGESSIHSPHQSCYSFRRGALWTEDSVARTLINPNYCLTDPPVVTGGRSGSRRMPSSSRRWALSPIWPHC